MKGNLNKNMFISQHWFVNIWKFISARTSLVLDVQQSSTIQNWTTAECKHGSSPIDRHKKSRPRSRSAVG